MAGQFKNTMIEGLQKVLKDVADLMLFPDADLDFLAELQAQIVSYAQQGQMPNSPQQPSMDPMMGGGPAPMMGPDGGIGPPGGAGGGIPPELEAILGDAGPMVGGIPGGGAEGMPPGAMPAPPNPDEMRRMTQIG